MIKRPGSWVAIVLLLLAVFSGYLYFKNLNSKIYPEEIIFKASEKFKPELIRFLSNVKQTIDKLKTDVRQVNVDALPVDSLNQYFSQMTNKRDQSFGFVLFGKKVNYVIFRDQDSWVYTYNDLQDSLINWQRIDKNLKPIPNGNWTDTYNNFMNENNFGSVKIPQLKKEKYVWRGAISTLPDRQELVFNIFMIGSIDDFDIAALVYKTSEIGTRFSSGMIIDNPLVSIMADNDKIVSPIRTKDTAKISSFRKLEFTVTENYQLWKKTFNKNPHTFKFDEFNKQYYSRFDTILPSLGVNGFVITASREDLLNSKKKVDEVYLYVALLFLLFALFVFFNSFNKLKKTKKKSKKILHPLPIHAINKMIEGGETEFIEFKSSLRWDYREEKVNKVLEDVIMKSIAAFANAKGGNLLIGVNDDLEIIGLENDFKTLKKQDADYFELHLRKMINNQYSIKFSNRYLQMQLPKIEGKIICVIQILPSDSALFMKTKNKQGQIVEKFYVRSGNASQEITSLTEVNDYIKERFDSA
jgi:hypothetical protein